MLKSDAVKAFLQANTHADLAALYNFSMEMQVNVSQGSGEAVEGEYQGKRWRGWSNLTTGEVWKPFRIPYNAATEPSYTDSEIKFALSKHADGIGLSGWDWQHKLSRWVFFDFDALTGHSDKHTRKLSDEELQAVRETVVTVPWVTLRKSTSGKGLHLYVFLTPTPTKNHNEHAALARAILGQLSGVCGVDFRTKVDVAGGNGWIWHRKMVGTDGLTLLKQGSVLSDIPPHWQDHLKVIRGERKKTTPFFIREMKNPDSESLFDQMSGQRVSIPLDEEHKKLMSFVKEINRSSWYDQDHRMLVCHTSDLKSAHQELQLRGIFETVATGKDKGNDWNCYLFPNRHGAWTVRRFTPGIAETPNWEQDANGWTKCVLNKEPDLATACRTFEGKEHSASGYVFDRAEQAAQAAALLGANLDLPAYLSQRKTRLKQHKDGRLVALVDHTAQDMNDPKLATWIAERGSWQKIFSVKIAAPAEGESINLDESLRHLITEDGNDFGWLIFANGEWQNEPLNHVKPALLTFGMKPQEVNAIIGASVFKAWRMVCRPFQPEYPGGREWNRNAPQLRFQASEDEILIYPTWKKIFQHCGAGLDSAIKDNTWCKQNGITCGSDYLMCWVSSLIKEPMEPLPYLFFWSTAQNTGKSTFHEALQLLLTSGYMRAEAALTSPGQFNGELLNTVLCVTEEIDLKKNQLAYNKIKDFVTAKSISIHIKGKTPFMVPNTTHWMQFSNSHLACPIFPGDSRITMIQVPELDLISLIPKKALIPLLEKEASHFLAAIKAIELPVSPDRLNLPIINTPEKQVTEAANQTMLELFFRERVHYVTGETILYSEFYDQFREWLDPAQYQNWSKVRVGRELPPDIPKGRVHGPNPAYFLGNISWNARPAGQPIKLKLVQNGEYIVPEGGTR